MESRAIELLRTILGQRGLQTDTSSVTVDKPDRTNVYKVGDVTVIVSQKDKGLQEKELRNLVNFTTEQGMLKNGVIIVSMAPPSENVSKTIRSLMKEAEGKLGFFHLNELQFDITTHRMVSPHRILKQDEVTEFLKERKIRNPEAELPTIDLLDIMARWIGAKHGDIVKIERHSDVAGVTDYYRYCLA